MPAGRNLTQLAGRPAFAAGQAAALLARWGLRGSLRELVSERDQNWLVVVDGAPAWVLKIANAEDGPELVDFQQQMMRCLAAAGIPCPGVLPTADGLPWAETEVGNLAWVITFLLGDALAAQRPAPAGLFADLGENVGRAAVALRGFDHPAAHDRGLQWDVRNAAQTLAAYAGSVQGAQRQALVREVLARFGERIAPVLDDLPASVIHNDANDHNVLVRDGRVSGLLDFGDAVHSVTVNDLAVACAYAMLDRPDPWRVARDVVAGYERHRPLTARERDLLPLFIRVRLATSVAISAYQQGVHPDNAYLRISEGPAWRLLERDDGPAL